MLYPALDVRALQADIALAVADDFSPTAVEESDGLLTIYFSDRRQRDAAGDAVRRAFPAASVSARDVDDEDWARRSQESLGPVTIGRMTIAPPWCVPDRPAPLFPTLVGPHSHSPALTIVIEPSMAFGTGHHATTRLCLVALQSMDLRGRFVLDVGSGSGILAIAARRLGADQVLGIDNDQDAISCALENRALNPGVDRISFELADLQRDPLNQADVITANLTGALLRRAASGLVAALAPDGRLIVSGVLDEERDEVVDALQGVGLEWEEHLEGWVGLRFSRP